MSSPYAPHGEPAGGWGPAGPPPPPVKNNKNKIGWIVVGVIGAIFLISVLVNIGSSSGDDEKGRDSTPTVEAPADNRDWAILACHDSIENQLKDPESADYKNEAAIRQTGQTYDVSGMVNAKNSYGGMVGFRAYTCSATLDPDGETMRATTSILE